MRTIKTSFLFFCIAVAPRFLFAADAALTRQLTLKVCVDMAMKQSEDLQITAEEIEQARQKMKQTTAAILPNIKWNFTSAIQDDTGVEKSTTGASDIFTRRTRNEAKFSARQPIFAGFREFSAHSAYAAQTRQLNYQFGREKIELFGQTAEAFYTVVLLETEKRNIETLIKLTQERVSELNDRVKLGKSRNSEVISAESQLASLKAQLVSAEGRIRSAREQLSFVIGDDATRSLLVDITPVPSPVLEENNILLITKNRSDVQSLQEKVISNRYAVRVARAGYFPKADVSGNYYTYRTGLQEEIDWDVLFNVDVPLFQGGGVRAQSKEALSVLRQSELELERLMRSVATEVRQAQSDLNTSISQSDMLKNAFEKARQSYTMQVKEYRLGLVNNLEVLAALNVMQEAKQRLDFAIVQSKLNWFRLQIAMEEEIL